LRILHLSHDSIPDWRVEKSALTGLNFGHEVLFAGGQIPKNYNSNIFSKVYEIKWSAKARYGIPIYWHAVRKRFQRILTDARPDIIHAHNIFSAKVASQFEIPLVYDDHEYWSKSSEVLREIEEQNSNNINLKNSNYFRNKLKRIKRRYVNDHVIKLWTRWERELVTSCPTITVSEQIARSLRLITNNKSTIFVVPNFPLYSEVKDLKSPTRHSGLSCVYAGGDSGNKIKSPQKNIDGFTDLFRNHDIGTLTMIGWSAKNSSSSRINYTGYLSRSCMFDEMCKSSIGLIPWKKHWSHAYISPNKAYEYAHAGLFVMCTASLNQVTKYLDHNYLTFDNFNDMILQLSYFIDNPEELYSKRLKIFEFARSKLLWENYEKNIYRAYQLAG
jgi:glycosyltransferase involved in cell wall biosynthesis